MPRYQADFLAYGTCTVFADGEAEAVAKINALVGIDADLQLGWHDMPIDEHGSFVSPAFTPQMEITRALRCDEDKTAVDDLP